MFLLVWSNENLPFVVCSLETETRVLSRLIY
jgi:hypothetical protein